MIDTKMSISTEKLSELLSYYQRVSAFTLAGPSSLQSCMVPRPINNSVSSGPFILPTHRAPTFTPITIQCASSSSSGSLVNNKDQSIRLSSISDCHDSNGSTAASDMNPEVEMVTFEGESIPAFAIGGERRLYMPMLLRRLLQRGFKDSAIQTACEELKIHFQEASGEQVEALRRLLKLDISRCGLIKRSDAERLWSSFDDASTGGEKFCEVDTKPVVALAPSETCSVEASFSSAYSPATSSESGDRFCDLPTPNSFRVYHACFGKQKGVFVPEWYTAPDARCIVCVRCGSHFSPERFVSHVHRATAENNVAHWGFDPAKWRAYLLLAKDQRMSKELLGYFDSLKCKFDASRKRKVCSVAPPHAPVPVMIAPRLLTISDPALGKKPRLLMPSCDKPLLPAVTRPDFHQVPANVTLPAETVTIAQAALASARATSAAATTNGTTPASTPTPPTTASATSTSASALTNTTEVARTTATTALLPTAFDSALSSVFVRELQAPQEAQEAELKTIRELLDGRTLSESEKTAFLSDATALRRRQLSLLSGVMYENVLLKQQLKTTKESSEKAIAAFAAENRNLRNERQEIESQLARCRSDYARLHHQLVHHDSVVEQVNGNEKQADVVDDTRHGDESSGSADVPESMVRRESVVSLCDASTDELDVVDSGDQRGVNPVRFEDVSTDEGSPVCDADKTAEDAASS